MATHCGVQAPERNGFRDVPGTDIVRLIKIDKRCRYRRRLRIALGNHHGTAQRGVIRTQG
jgi:hypothetical protein